MKKKKNDLKKTPEKSRKFEKREIANTLFSEKKSGILYYSGIPLSLFCSLVQLNEYSAGTDRMRTREERRGEERRGEGCILYLLGQESNRILGCFVSSS
jgi:hypothetical protein